MPLRAPRHALRALGHVLHLASQWDKSGIPTRNGPGGVLRCVSLAFLFVLFGFCGIALGFLRFGWVSVGLSVFSMGFPLGGGPWGFRKKPKGVGCSFQTTQNG